MLPVTTFVHDFDPDFIGIVHSSSSRTLVATSSTVSVLSDSVSFISPAFPEIASLVSSRVAFAFSIV